MTKAEAPTSTELLDAIEATARTLDATDVIDNVAAVREYQQSTTVKLLIAGAVGSGRATVANRLLGDALLPASPTPKGPAGVSLRHGERFTAARTARDGSRSVLTADGLRTFLRDQTVPAGGFAEIRAPSPLLLSCDLRIEAIDAEHPPGDWKSVVLGTDYVILVLNATSLLSTAERAFVRDVLAPQSGLQRTAIVLNQMDRIPDEERASLLELARAFLGPFEGAPAIIPMSADSGKDSSDGRPTGFERLHAMVTELIANHGPVRAGAVRQALDDMLNALEIHAERTSRLLGMEESDVLEMQRAVESVTETLTARIERAQGRVNAFIRTLLRERLLRRIEGFGETFRARLPDEIATASDPRDVRRYLPGYIETVWTDFLRRQLIALRGDLRDEMDAVDEIIQSDLLEIAAGSGLSVEGDPGLDFDLHAFHVFLMPRRGKHRAVNVARGLSFHGFLMLMFSPALGLASLAAGQAVTRVFRGDIHEADRQALTTSALAAARELERDVKTHAEQRLAETADQINEAIAQTYQEALDQVRESLDERIAARTNLAERRDAVSLTLRETIPELRARLDALGGSPAA